MNAIILAAVLATTDSPEPPPPDVYVSDSHLEASFGFMGGYRDLSRMPFAFEDGTSGEQALTEPFASAPYSGLPVMGVSGELRVVSHHLRFTVGLQKPFASFRLTDAVSGDVSTRSLSLWDFRFGLGGEYAFEYVAPFVDLLGDMQVVSASLTVGNQTADYKAWAFGFTVRAGVRFHLSKYLYIAPSAEVGLGGAQRFGASLQAGWVIPV
jgi:hypothetical protein